MKLYLIPEDEMIELIIIYVSKLEINKLSRKNMGLIKFFTNKKFNFKVPKLSNLLKFNALTKSEKLFVLKNALHFLEGSIICASVEEQELFYNRNAKVIMNEFWTYSRSETGLIITDIFGKRLKINEL